MAKGKTHRKKEYWWGVHSSPAADQDPRSSLPSTFAVPAVVPVDRLILSNSSIAPIARGHPTPCRALRAAEHSSGESGDCD